jgi:outer membrane receptor protein involved in Fe transport
MNLSGLPHCLMKACPAKNIVRCAVAAVCLFPSTWLPGQGASAAAASEATPALLARYDANRNGRLDPEELRLLESDRVSAASAVTREKPATGDEQPVQLSPFEVIADNKGYYASTTMSGTRLNSSLEDLASAIAVISKEQMSDFAMLDINDVFLYAANTEGIGTFTDFAMEDGNGVITDNASNDPANANRIRGIGNANVSSENFETSNRVPIDPIDADAIEISRGPNANVFGLGNAAGTVNIVSARANLNRHRSTVSFRADSFEGHRASLDVNRVLSKGRLAVRVSAVRQHDGFDLKPSGVDTNRYNGMIQFRPFKRTTINAGYQFYSAHGNRPNTLPPLDGITDWREGGSPTWDPIANTLKRDGVVIGTSTPATLFTPAGNYGQVFVDRDGIRHWSGSYGVSGATPLVGNQTNRKLVVTRARVNDAQPLIARRVEMVSDQSVYDWSSINLAALNRFHDRTETSRVSLDQMVFDTGAQSLAVQGAWLREDSERNVRYITGDGSTAGPTGQLSMDVNERLLDGSPSPFFMRPMLVQSDPRQLQRSPLRNDTYRGQFAYKFDFTGRRGASRWLGAHSVVGYIEYKEKVQRNYRYVGGIVSDHPWLFPSPTANRTTAVNVRTNLRLYVGDNQGGNVDHAPGDFSFGDYTFLWGNAVTGAMVREPVRLGLFPSGVASGSISIQKTGGAIWQSRFLGGRIVGTLGRREDRHFTRFQNPTTLADRGAEYDFAAMNPWREADWQLRTGGTEQRGVVVKPLRGIGPLDRAATSSNVIVRAIADAARGLTLHYNQSDSFRPAAPAQNVYGQWLPDPSGKGRDYGFSLNFSERKLVLRVNKYETEQNRSRNGASATFARTIWAIDHTSTAFALQQEATEWITEAATAAARTLTPAQLNEELTRVMGVAPRIPGEVSAIPVSETDDIVGRGHEVELHFNPTTFWTVQASFTEKRAFNSRLAPNVTTYLAQRLPIWTTIVDPRTNALWWTTNYGGSETPFENYRRVLANPLNVALATEGLSRPQVRRYRLNLTTNFRLAGITSHPALKRLNVGGALRYESRGAIGYYGRQQLPAIITEYDVSRPVWDKPHTYMDGFVGYRTRLWSNKVGAAFQLNVRNLQENGRLQPIGAGPDGTPHSFRIVAPRQFILTATFEL